MRDCRAVRSELERLAATPRAAWPPGAAAHVAGCAACARALAVARLARGLVAAALRGPEPDPGFAGRVAAALGDAGRRQEGADLSRPAWVLFPVFGTVAGLLLVLTLQSPGPMPAATVWPEPSDPASITDRVVFGPDTLGQDLVLAAVLEES